MFWDMQEDTIKSIEHVYREISSNIHYIDYPIITEINRNKQPGNILEFLELKLTRRQLSSENNKYL